MSFFIHSLALLATPSGLSLVPLKQEFSISPEATGRCLKALSQMLSNEALFLSFPKASLPRPQPSAQSPAFLRALLVPIHMPTYTKTDNGIQQVRSSTHARYSPLQCFMEGSGSPVGLLSSRPLLSIVSLDSPNSSEIGLISDHSQRGKWRLREVNSSTQGHTAGKWQD